MEDWMVYWTDCSVSMERIMDMKRYQRINHFPGMIEICRKDLLARNLNRMRRLFPKEYNIFPKTWCLPTDYIEFQGYCRMWKHKTIICKPESGCQGKGIYITRQPQGISPDEHIICQTYISKPFIIDEYKFDLRLYVLVTSCDPLRIFLFKEGLVRFATSKYRNPHNNNIDDMCMHLTNYAINKHSEHFDHDLQKGSKRKLSWLRSWLEQHLYDTQSVWNSIEDVITKTVIVAEPVLRQNYRTAFPSHVGPSSCFELLGFDILLDCKLKPWLIEVNHSPSFNTDSALDTEVKETLLMDTLTLLNLGACDRRRIVEVEKRMAQERLLQKHQTSSLRELVLSSQASWLAEAEWHEEQHPGGFYRIYPRGDDCKYSKFLDQGSSYCQETVTSRAREEYARRMVQMQQDKEMTTQGRSPGKRWSHSEGRGQQGESLGEQSRKSKTDLRGNGKHMRWSHSECRGQQGESLGEQSRKSKTDLREDGKYILRQPSTVWPGNWVFEERVNQSGSSSCMAWDSYETRMIIEEEELARQRDLAQRDTLLRQLGMVDAIQSLLRPKTYHPTPAKTHRPIRQKWKLQLREPLLYTTYSCPEAHTGQQFNLPRLCQQQTKLATGTRSGGLSVCVIKLALHEKQEHRQPTLPLITGRSVDQWRCSLKLSASQESDEDLSRGHMTESHNSLSFSSVDEEVLLEAEHSEAKDPKPKRFD
ncbi:tubulin polyglutamylase TTLL13-like isoform X2 [Clupea harengus]|nr:tubulin polyglutamylase TTLL13-like isoform X2 [Clupea harengus]